MSKYGIIYSYHNYINQRRNVMSISKLNTVFTDAPKHDSWSIQLLHTTVSRRDGINYCSREITLSPKRRLDEFVSELSAYYVNAATGLLHSSFTDVVDYDGTAQEKIIYKLSADNILIKDAYKRLLTAIADPDVVISPLEFSSEAYLLKGEILIDRDICPVKFISMKRPVNALKNRFIMDKSSFKEITEKVLYLRPTLDVVILGECVYIFTLLGENLFNMEHAYKAVCKEKIDEIIQCNILSSDDMFRAVAGSGYNPRRFISFNNNRLNMLQNDSHRKFIAQKFEIPLINGKLDTSSTESVDKIVKLLCNKGMVDPFEDVPIEVASAKKWS